MHVQHILQGKPSGVKSVPSTTTIAAAAERLSAERIGALIVSDDGVTMRGILSERDIVREIGTRGAGCLTDEVRDIMTAKVVFCTPDETAVSVLERMTEGKFRHMPVLQDDKLLGVVTLGDVVKARLEMMARENEALTDMIAGY